MKKHKRKLKIVYGPRGSAPRWRWRKHTQKHYSGRHFNINFIPIFATTCNTGDDEIEEYYKQLEQTQTCPILQGDWINNYKYFCKLPPGRPYKWKTQKTLKGISSEITIRSFIKETSFVLKIKTTIDTEWANIQVPPTENVYINLKER